MEKRSIKDGFVNGQSAQALIEFAFILPVMLIVVLGSIDIGRALVYGVAVQDGAREAARFGTTAGVDISVTDTAVLNRLIAASAPALSGCTAITTLQACGGGNWTFTVEDVTTNPLTLVTTTYTNLLNDGLGSNGYARKDANFSGSQLRVTATGSVSMLAGLQTAWGLSLNPITARGQTIMVMQ